MENLEIYIDGFFSDFMLQGSLIFQVIKISVFILIFSVFSGCIFAFFKSGQGVVRIVAILVAASSITHFAIKEKKERDEQEIEAAEEEFDSYRRGTLSWLEKTLSEVGLRDELTTAESMSRDLTEGALERVQSAVFVSSTGGSVNRLEAPNPVLSDYQSSNVITSADKDLLESARIRLSTLKSYLDSVHQAEVSDSGPRDVSSVYYLFVISFLIGAGFEIGSEMRMTYRRIFQSVSLIRD